MGFHTHAASACLLLDFWVLLRLFIFACSKFECNDCVNVNFLESTLFMRLFRFVLFCYVAISGGHN